MLYKTSTATTVGVIDNESDRKGKQARLRKNRPGMGAGRVRQDKGKKRNGPEQGS